MLPTFVIIGAQKSASTFIQACLAEHPDIYLPPEETPFFESPDYENSEMRELESIFEERTEKCLGIKRPNYIGKMEVPARIQKHLPDAKLIAVLRNPIDRAISAYFHNINNGFVPPLDVEIGMRKLILEPSFSSENKRSSEIIEFGYYHKYLTKYGQYINNNQLLIFLYEDIVSNPLESIRRSYEFLGLSQDFTPKSLRSRPQKVLYNLTRLKLIRHRNRFMYDYNEDRTRLFTKKMTLIEKIFAKSLTLLDRKILSRLIPNNKPKIGLELHNMLYDLYAHDIESLENLISRDLSAWKPSDKAI